MEKINQYKQYGNAKFDDFSSVDFESSEIEKLKKWVAEAKHFMLLSGAVGSGKTHFCAAFCNQYDSTLNIKYLCSNGLYLRIYSLDKPEDLEIYGVTSQKVNSLIDEIKNHEGFLIIEDLDVFLNESWKSQVFIDIIEHRYSEKLPTLITYSECLFNGKLTSLIFNGNSLEIKLLSSDKRKQGL